MRKNHKDDLVTVMIGSGEHAIYSKPVAFIKKLGRRIKNR